MTYRKIDYSYWAHSENVILAMLGDEREEVRRQAVLRIKRAREEFNDSDHPRQFKAPVVNFGATDYTRMIDWETEPCTEPPLTMEMPIGDIVKACRAPLKMPNYPNHTQRVEAMVRVVTEVAPKRAGHEARERMILQLLESREKCPVFDTKKHGMALL